MVQLGAQRALLQLATTDRCATALLVYTQLKTNLATHMARRCRLSPTSAAMLARAGWPDAAQPTLNDPPSKEATPATTGQRHRRAWRWLCPECRARSRSRSRSRLPLRLRSRLLTPATRPMSGTPQHQEHHSSSEADAILQCSYMRSREDTLKPGN